MKRSVDVGIGIVLIEVHNFNVIDTAEKGLNLSKVCEGGGDKTE
jgi:hypothetical protein